MNPARASSNSALRGGTYSETPLGAWKAMVLQPPLGWLESGKERVGPALDADGRLRAVAGQHKRVVALPCQRAGQAAQHRLVIAARQVRAADRAGEQQVAGEQGAAARHVRQVRRAVGAEGH